MPLSPRLKYRNKPTTLGGLKFASQAEARRYGELCLLQRAGQITNIVLQPKFPLTVSGMTIGTYIADFSYTQNNNLVVEDVKSPATRTPLYRLKQKLMIALYGIAIVEIESRAGGKKVATAKKVSRC